VASIEAVHARQILDSAATRQSRSRSCWTTGRSAGRGAQRRVHRRVRGGRARDGGAEYGGKGVTRAVDSVIDEIQPELLGHDADDQRLVDQALIDLDRTPDKSRLGANAIIGVSPWRWPGPPPSRRAAALPLPGRPERARAAGADDEHPQRRRARRLQRRHPGVHDRADRRATFAEALRWGAETYHALKSVLKQHGLSTGVGDEGGFAPTWSTTGPRST
jgi:enolase